MIKGLLLSLSHAGVDTQQTADQQSRGTDTAGTQQSQQTHRGQQCTEHASRRTEAGGEQWERTWGSAVGCSSGSAQGRQVCHCEHTTAADPVHLASSSALHWKQPPHNYPHPRSPSPYQSGHVIQDTQRFTAQSVRNSGLCYPGVKGR